MIKKILFKLAVAVLVIWAVSTFFTATLPIWVIMALLIIIFIE